jgi:hypothetical protein
VGGQKTQVRRGERGRARVTPVRLSPAPRLLGQSLDYRFLGVLKSLLNGCDLAVSVFIDFLLCELLLHGNPNPRSKHKACKDHFAS